MLDISNELSTTQDGLVFLLVRFLLQSSLTSCMHFIRTTGASIQKTKNS